MCTKTKNLIHTLSQTNFDLFTLKVEGSTVSPTKKRSSWLTWSYYVDSKEFNEALTKLLKRIHSCLDILKDTSINLQVTKIANELTKQVKEIKDLKETDPAYKDILTKISLLANSEILYQWNHSSTSMRELLRKSPIVNDSIHFADARGELFTQQNFLGISYRFIQKYTDKEIKKELFECFKNHPSLNTIQIQGYSPISLKKFKAILKKGYSLKELPFPSICEWDVKKRTVYLHPSLLFNSRLEEIKNSEINSGDILPKTIRLLNKYESNLKNIPINDENIESLIRIARYLHLSKLLKKCDLFRCKETSRMSSFDNLCSLYKISLENDFPYLQTVCEKKLLKKENFKSLIQSLEKLKAKDIKIKNLNLSNTDWLTDDCLETILEYCPHLASLNISGCKSLTEGCGLLIREKLTQLTSLDLSANGQFSNNIIHHIQDLPLHRLIVSGCSRLTKEIGVPLKNLVHLQIFECQNNPNITDYLGNGLQGLPLRYLDLTGCEITSGFGIYLVKMKSLISLGLGCEGVNDDIGKSIQELTNLRRLNLSRSSITHNIGQHFSKIPLTQIDLSRCMNLTDEIGKYFVECPYLKDVNLSGCSHLTDQVIFFLAKKEEYLRSFNFAETQITDASMPLLKSLIRPSDSDFVSI